eukprot:scaffold146160_cov44-Prasinocladus_malaysianus.AAC.1
MAFQATTSKYVFDLHAPTDVYFCTADCDATVNIKWGKHILIKFVLDAQLEFLTAYKRHCRVDYRTHLPGIWPNAQRGLAGRSTEATSNACLPACFLLLKAERIPGMPTMPQVVFEGVPSYPDASRFWEIVDKYN